MRRGDVVFAETPEWSLVVDPGSGAPHLYDPGHDPLQRRDMAAGHSEAAARLERDIREQQALWDYLVERNRVWPAHGAEP
jgi:hypothetical protein